MLFPINETFWKVWNFVLLKNLLWLEKKNNSAAEEK